MKKFLAISKRNFFKPLSNLGAVLPLLSTDLKTKYDKPLLYTRHT